MCEAFTKSCKRCRANPQANGLCRVHKTFYEDGKPIMFLMTHYHYMISNKKRALLGELLKNRRIRTDEPSWLKILDCFYKGVRIDEVPEVEPFLRERAIYLYSFLLRSKVITPDAVPMIWAELFQRAVNLIPYYVEPNHLRSPRTSNPKLIEFLYMHLIPLFTSGKTGAQFASLFLVFKRGLEQFEQITNQLYSFPYSSEGWLQIWKRILEELVKNIPKSSLMIQNPTLFLQMMNETTKTWSTNSLWYKVRLHMEALLACEAATEKQRMRKTNQKLKEELVATALHPDRIAKYIRAGIRPSEL